MSYSALIVTNIAREKERKDYKYKNWGFFPHCSYSSFGLKSLICFYGTEKMCVSNAYTFCKQTKGDDWGYRTAASNIY